MFSGGWSPTGGSADRTNNLENVYVKAADSGTWTLEVKGYNVPNGPQPFALVVDGADTDLATASGGGGTTTTVMHIGDLDKSAKRYSNGWTATVTATVHDASDNPVSDATVSGTWSYSTSTVSCKTYSTGKCSITSGRISKNTSSVSFTVTGISRGTDTYDATKNHDPDGDSNGTKITINKP